MYLRLVTAIAVTSACAGPVLADAVDDRLAQLGIQVRGNVAQAINAACDGSPHASLNGLPFGCSVVIDQVADADGTGTSPGADGDAEEPAGIGLPNGFNARRTVILYVPDNPATAEDDSFLYLGFDVSDRDSDIDVDVAVPSQFDSDNNGDAKTVAPTALGINDGAAEFYSVFLRLCAEDAALSGFDFSIVNPDDVFNNPDYVIQLQMNASVGTPTTLGSTPVPPGPLPPSDGIGNTRLVFPRAGLDHLGGANDIETFLNGNSLSNDVEFVLKRVDTHIGAFQMARLIARFDAGSTGEGFDEERATNFLLTDLPALEVDKQVRCEGDTPWLASTSATPGSVVEFLITVENAGNVDLDVTLQDVITNQCAAAGMTTITAAITEQLAGGNGIANTTASGDDVQVVAVGDPVFAGQVIILPGPNGVINSAPAGGETSINTTMEVRLLPNGVGPGTVINFANAAANDLNAAFFGPNNNQFLIDARTGLARRLGMLGAMDTCPDEVPGDVVTVQFKAFVTAGSNFCATCSGTAVDVRNTITATGDPDQPPAVDGDEVTGTASADVNLRCRNLNLEKLVSAPGGPLVTTLDLNTLNGNTGPVYPQDVIYTYRATNGGEAAEAVSVTERFLCGDVAAVAGVSLVDCDICTGGGTVNLGSAAAGGGVVSDICRIRFDSEVALMSFLTRDDVRDPAPDSFPTDCGDPSTARYRNCITGSASTSTAGVCDNGARFNDFATITFAPGCLIEVTKGVRCTEGGVDGPLFDNDPNDALPDVPLPATPGARSEFVVRGENIGAVPIETVCITDTLSCQPWLVGGTLAATVNGAPVSLATACGVAGGFNFNGAERCFILSTPIPAGGVLEITFEVEVPANFASGGTATDCTNNVRIEGYTTAAPCPPTAPNDEDCTSEDNARINVLITRQNCLKEVSAEGEAPGGPFAIGPAAQLNLPEGTQFPPASASGPILTYTYVMENNGDTDLDMEVCDQALADCVASSGGSLTFGACDLDAGTGCFSAVVASGDPDRIVSCEVIVNSNDGFDHLADCDGDGNGTCFNNIAVTSSERTNLPTGICIGDGEPADDSCTAQVCLRPPGDCPRCTSARVAIWNQNEIRFSGTERCVCEWDSTLLTGYGVIANHFLRTSIQTDRGKARIDGLFNPNCGADTVDSEPLPLLGTASRLLRFPDQSLEETASPLTGIGMQGGLITHQILDSEIIPDGSADLHPAASDVATTSRQGSMLVFVSVQAMWDANENVIRDTFIELTNDLETSTRIQMYLVGEIELCNSVDFNFCLTPNQPTYWSASTGRGAAAGGTDAQGDCSIIQSLSAPPVRQLAVPVRENPADPTSQILGYVFRGYVVLWAATEDGSEIAHNGLGGRAMIIDYGYGSAQEYEPWAFRTLNTPQGQQSIDAMGVTPGRLLLDGFEYSAAPDQLLFDFYTVGTTLSSPDGNSVQVLDTELSLWTAIKELRH
jgi:uncharacterized repeat protein (TIGR01451 family)